MFGERQMPAAPSVRASCVCVCVRVQIIIILVFHMQIDKQMMHSPAPPAPHYLLAPLPLLLMQKLPTIITHSSMQHYQLHVRV